MILRLPRLRPLFFILFALLIVGITLTYKNWKNESQRCFMDTQGVGDEDLEASPLEDVLLAEPKPVPGRSIFFHETSCQLQTENRRYKLLELTSRQACAIESAALHNPNFQVFVLFAAPTYRRRSNTTQPLVEAILSYSNVHLRRLNLWSYAAGTPIEEWLQGGSLFHSKYLYSHMSDFLRYLTLYRYGGLYLDMDVVVLRSMEEVPPNFTGAESNTDLAAGVMSLGATSIGHEIADLCLRDFQLNFDGQNWGKNGPGVITRVAQKICATKDLKLMQEDPERCLGFKVFGKDAFYAVHWLQWRDFFEPEKLAQTMALTKDSYVVHVWNKLSSTLKIRRNGTGSAYAKYAKENCPRAYEAAGEYF